MTLLAGAESEWCANAWLFLVAAAVGTGLREGGQTADLVDANLIARGRL